MSLFEAKNLVLASYNLGKLKEIQSFLSPYGFSINSASDLGLPEPEETEETFEGNASLKARTIALASGRWALADDSGLCVEALGGEPGVYSGRWAERTPGGPRDFNYAFEKLADMLEKEKAIVPYTAEMVCVLSLSSPQGEIHNFRGVVKGTLTFPARGNQGFGYDPIFVPLGSEQTFAENPELKKKFSHRRRAFNLLEKALTSL